MQDFELGGRKFKVGKMNAFKQFHVVRRIAPILADLLPAIKEVQKINKKVDKTESEKFEEAAQLLGPLLNGFSKLSDDDSDKVLLSLLMCAEVQLGGAWSKVATENMIMVQDLELPALLQIAGRAFMFNLSSFFTVLPQVS